MHYKDIKILGKKWSNITLGCWQIAPSEGWGDKCSPGEADAIVKTALDQGITAFDTAEGYGDGESERRLGKGLGSQKDDVIVVSKLWPDAKLTEKAYFERIDGTLRALGRDYVDVYLMHWVSDELEDTACSARMCELMLKIKESGKARMIGLSNFHLKDLKRLGIRMNEFSINQVPYNLLDRSYEGETLNVCKKLGLGYMSYSPIGRGLLGRRMTDVDFNCRARRVETLYGKTLYEESSKVFDVVESIAKEIGQKPAEIATAWVLAQDNILTAIVGSRSVSQLKDFSGTGDLELSEEMLERLKRASDLFEEKRKELTK